MREYVDEKLDPELRRNTLALDLGRIDRLSEICYTKALTGDLKAVDLCDRLIMRRAVALGLTAPRESLIRIVEQQAPPPTSSQRIEEVLRQLADRRRSTEPIEAESEPEPEPEPKPN